MRTRVALSACLCLTAVAALSQNELRSIPAEQTAAAVTDSNWEAPRTSWGDPSLAASGLQTTCAASLSAGREILAKDSP